MGRMQLLMPEKSFQWPKLLSEMLVIDNWVSPMVLSMVAGTLGIQIQKTVKCHWNCLSLCDRGEDSLTAQVFCSGLSVTYLDYSKSSDNVISL